MNKIEENLAKWKEIEAKVIARALTDEAFRTRLEQDPRETIETEFQCKVSGDVTFRVCEEENPGEMTILLPKLPKKEMGEQLDRPRNRRHRGGGEHRHRGRHRDHRHRAGQGDRLTVEGEPD